MIEWTVAVLLGKQQLRSNQNKVVLYAVLSQLSSSDSRQISVERAHPLLLLIKSAEGPFLVARAERDPNQNGLFFFVIAINKFYNIPRLPNLR